MNPLQPSSSLLCKLGSIVVHVEEMHSETGHQFDAVAFRQLMDDSEVVEWRQAMQKMGMLPVKRTRGDLDAAAVAKVRKRLGDPTRTTRGKKR